MSNDVDILVSLKCELVEIERLEEFEDAVVISFGEDGILLICEVSLIYTNSTSIEGLLTSSNPLPSKTLFPAFEFQ